MALEGVERRVAALEKTVQNQVTSADLEALQVALGTQILQLGAEMRAAFSATRDEIRAGDERTAGLIEERTAELLAVIAAGDEETRRHARVLHHEVIERIKTIRTG